MGLDFASSLDVFRRMALLSRAQCGGGGAFWGGGFLQSGPRPPRNDRLGRRQQTPPSVPQRIHAHGRRPVVIKQTERVRSYLGFARAGARTNPARNVAIGFSGPGLRIARNVERTTVCVARRTGVLKDPLSKRWTTANEAARIPPAFSSWCTVALKTGWDSRPTDGEPPVGRW